MVKCQLDNGLVFYSCSAYECIHFLGGLGICDDCGLFARDGYLVPVLNHFMCPKCFKEWASRCEHYPEDDWFEQIYIHEFESLIPVEYSDHYLSFDLSSIDTEV